MRAASSAPRHCDRGPGKMDQQRECPSAIRFLDATARGELLPLRGTTQGHDLASTQSVQTSLHWHYAIVRLDLQLSALPVVIKIRTAGVQRLLSFIAAQPVHAMGCTAVIQPAVTSKAR